MGQLAPFRLPSTPARTDLVAKYFRALGDPTRLRILGVLQAEGELSAGELTRRLGQPQPKVSNHLACLRWCGFVTTRRDHRVIYYRLATSGSRPCSSWPMGCWLTTPSMWPPAAASPRPDMPAATNRQPTGARRPLVEVLITPDCPTAMPPSP